MGLSVWVRDCSIFGMADQASHENLVNLAWENSQSTTGCLLPFLRPVERNYRESSESPDDSPTDYKREPETISPGGALSEALVGYGMGYGHHDWPASSSSSSEDEGSAMLQLSKRLAPKHIKDGGPVVDYQPGKVVVYGLAVGCG